MTYRKPQHVDAIADIDIVLNPDGDVIIDFGKPILRLGMYRLDAITFAMCILKIVSPHPWEIITDPKPTAASNGK